MEFMTVVSVIVIAAFAYTIIKSIRKRKSLPPATTRPPGDGDTDGGKRREKRP